MRSSRAYSVFMVLFWWFYAGFIRSLVAFLVLLWCYHPVPLLLVRYSFGVTSATYSTCFVVLSWRFLISTICGLDYGVLWVFGLHLMRLGSSIQPQGGSLTLNSRFECTSLGKWGKRYLEDMHYLNSQGEALWDELFKHEKVLCWSSWCLPQTINHKAYS